MTITPIKPSGIVLLTTLRCTAACDNCCFGCTPKQGRTMTLDEMKNYVDMSLAAYPDTISSLDLTGGECMLLGKDIERIMSYAKSKGLKSSMVSNAFWATDYDKAYSTLKRLKRCGLTKVSFSTGADHNRYVPWMNVRNASVAASRLGMETELRVELQFGHMEIARELENDKDILELKNQGILKFSMNTWMNYSKDNRERNRKMRYIGSVKKNSCQSLFQSIIINPYGEVYACCGIGVCHIPQMRLGNVYQEPVNVIYERAFEDFMKVWLFVDGPDAVLKYVHQKTGQKFPCHTSHLCDICRAIFRDKTIIPLINENFYDAAYIPLISYETIAKNNNESRTKR